MEKPKRPNWDLLVDIFLMRKANVKYHEHDEICAGDGEMILGSMFWINVIMIVVFSLV